jgi:hypothetical protein
VHHMLAAPTTEFLYLEFLFGQLLIGGRAIVPPFTLRARQGYLFARHY